jgi:hypothetical protein
MLAERIVKTKTMGNKWKDLEVLIMFNLYKKGN